MSFRTLPRDTLVYGGASLLVRGQQLLLIPIYTQHLGAAQYGVVETMAIAAALANLTVALEVAQGMARSIADAPDNDARARYATTALIFAGICYLLFVFVGCLVADPLSAWLFQGMANSQTLIIALASIAFNGLFAIALDLLRWQLQPVAFLVASLIYIAVGAVVGGGLVSQTSMGVAGVFIGQLAGASMGLLIAAALAHKSLRPKSFSAMALRTMLQFSLPLVMSSAAIFASSYIDRIVVGGIMGPAALGVYGVASRVGSIVGILAVGLQAALSPLVYRSWQQSETPIRLAQIFRIYAVAMVPVIGTLSLFSSEIISMLTGPDFADASIVLPVLAMASMLFSAYIFAPGLFLGGRTGIAAMLSLTSALANLLLCLLLTSILGILGAALSGLAAGTFVFAGHVVLGSKYFKVPFDSQRLIAIGCLLGFLVAGGMLAAFSLSDGFFVFLAKLSALLIACYVGYKTGLTENDRATVSSILTKYKLGPKNWKATE